MAKHSLLVGSTSWIDYVRITDMNGSPITGLVFNSTGLLSKYVLSGAASVAITLATQTVTGAYSSGGFVEIDATAFPGLYRLDVPNAALASGNKSYVSLYGYSGMNVTMLEYDLVAYNPQDAVRLGLSSLPNASAGATNGLPLSVDSSGRVDVLKINGTSQTARDIGASVLLSSGTGTGQLDFTSGVVKANLVQILSTALTETSGQIAAAFKHLFDVASPTLTCLDINQTGDSFARIGTAGVGLTNLGDTRIANLDTTVSSRTKPADTQAAVTTVTNLTNAPTSGDFNATMKTSLNAATPTVTVSDKTGFSLSAPGIQAIWDALTSALSTVSSIGKLLVDNINTTISSRSTYAGTDTSGTTTLLTRIPGVVQPQTGDSYARIGVAGAGLTAIGDARVAHLDADVSSRTKPADTQAAVTLVATTTAVTNDVGITQPAADKVWGSASRTLTSFGTLVADAAAAVWAATTRVLTAFSFTVTATADPNVALIKTKTDNLPASPAAVSDIPTANANADALLDRANGIETGVTLRQGQRVQLAAAAGKLSGAATTTIKIRDTGDSKDRVTATVDADGNRTAVTLDTT